MAAGTHNPDVDAQTQAVIDSLDASEREQLQALIVEADRVQREQLEHAVENAVTVIPAPLRKRFLKLIFG